MVLSLEQAQNSPPLDLCCCSFILFGSRYCLMMSGRVKTQSSRSIATNIYSLHNYIYSTFPPLSYCPGSYPCRSPPAAIIPPTFPTTCYYYVNLLYSSNSFKIPWLHICPRIPPPHYDDSSGTPPVRAVQIPSEPSLL